MKEHAALVIAALMITSMAFAMSTTSVSVPSTFSASASASPDKTGSDKWAVLTFSITNDTGYEIRRILIRDEPENLWDSPIGGNWSTNLISDNWDNIADNLVAFGNALSRFSDNLEEVEVAMLAAGADFKLAAENLDDAGVKLNNADNDNVKQCGYNIAIAADHLKEAAALLATERDNGYMDLDLIAQWIENATGTSGNLNNTFQRAADNLRRWVDVNQMGGLNYTTANDNLLQWAGENLGFTLASDNVGNPGWLDNAADFIRWGFFKKAALCIENAAENVKVAGENLRDVAQSQVDIDMQDGADLLITEVYTNLIDMANHLENMAENLKEAGRALENIHAQYLEWYAPSGPYAQSENVPRENLQMDNMRNQLLYLPRGFINYIEDTARSLDMDNLLVSPWVGPSADEYENRENILAAGENLRWAGLALSGTHGENMVEFGGRYLGSRSDSADNMLVRAGDNLRNRFALNITVAVSALDNAGTKFVQAGNKLKETAAKLAPNNWSLREPVGCPKGDVELEAENYEYNIAAGSSTNFVFLWRAPTVGKTYTFKIWYYDNDNIYRGYDTASIEVDSTAPKVVSFTVTQTGGIDNLVGTVRDNGKAKITLVASEALSELGTTYIENAGQPENLLPSIAMADWTTTDNITFEYEFTVGAWDDNYPRVRIAAPWATDVYLNENSANAFDNFIVDTQKPIIIDNGLSVLYALPWKTQPGTGNRYRVDNDTQQIIQGTIQDNTENLRAANMHLHRFGYDNMNSIVVPSITIEYDGENENVDLLPNENFYKAVTLAEGLNSAVTIKTTDWAGNSDNRFIENMIFIDTRPPTIVFNTISGVAWTENGQFVNDNTPEIKVTITDPGYPTTGWGVARLTANNDNLRVLIDNDDNHLNNPFTGIGWGTGWAFENLDNKAAWDPSTGVFENVIDNAGKGLATGTYWIIVIASDNLVHVNAENENAVIAKQSFTIDVTKPGWTTANVSGAMTLLDPDNPSVATGGTIPPLTTKKTTWLINGGAWEAGSTVKVYVGDIVKSTVTASLTDQTFNAARYDFSVSITLSEGRNQSIYIEEIDRAGNTSGKILYGTYTVDKTPPVITLSAPADGTTTDAAQITVSGTVTDAIVTDYQTLGVTIDCTGAAVEKTVYLNIDGSFSATVPLVEGSNVINVVAVDAAVTVLAGNQTVTTRTVTRTVTPWATYAIIVVIVALILAAIAIFRKR